MNVLKLRQILLMLLLGAMILIPLYSQEEEAVDPEVAEYKRRLEEYRTTGIELYLYYPVSFYFPGWSYAEIEHELGPIIINLPGPNISYKNFGGGAEFDFGSRKPVLKDMGVGMAAEISTVAPANMKNEMEMGLFLSYFYLYYNSSFSFPINFALRSGIGIGYAPDSAALFAYPEEKTSPAGPLYHFDAAVVFPPVLRFRFQAGVSYKYLPIHTKRIHIISPYVRAGFRF